MAMVNTALVNLLANLKEKAEAGEVTSFCGTFGQGPGSLPQIVNFNVSMQDLALAGVALQVAAGNQYVGAITQAQQQAEAQVEKEKKPHVPTEGPHDLAEAPRNMDKAPSDPAEGS